MTFDNLHIYDIYPPLFVVDTDMLYEKSKTRENENNKYTVQEAKEFLNEKYGRVQHE